MADIALHVAGCAAASIGTAATGELEGAKEPVKAEFLEVVLGDFEEAGLDFHLAWGCGQRDLHEGIDQVQVGLCVLDQELAAGCQISRGGSWWKRDALGLQELLGT